jgi:hypothetical protein
MTGFSIDWMDGNCPVQAEGRVDGKPFYFRARGQQWSIEVYPGPGDLRAEWRYEEPWGEAPYDAGWMPQDTAREMIATAVAIYRQRAQTPQ